MFNNIIPLNEFITLQRGFDLPKKDRENGSIPVVASTGIGGYHNEAKVKGPGVVIGRSGSIGGGQYITGDFWPLNTTLWVKDFKGHYPKYVFYLLRNIDFKFLNVGSGVPTLNRNHLSTILVPDIEYNQEKRIADYISSFDNKIEINVSNNKILEQIAQAIFKSWFVDFDPVKAKMNVLSSGGSKEEATIAAMSIISGKTEDELIVMQSDSPNEYNELKTSAELFPSSLQDSELGEIPEGWRTLALYDTAKYVNGSSFKPNSFCNKNVGHPIIKIAELKNGVGDTTKYTNMKIHEKYHLKDGDVLYSWSGSPETSLEVFKWFSGFGYLNQHIFKVNFDNDFQKYYTYNLLRYLKPLLISIAKQKQTTGLGHITVSDMKRIKVVIPGEKDLDRYVKSLGFLYKKSSELIKENTTLNKIKETLLPKLLSGELDVSNIKV